MNEIELAEKLERQRILREMDKISFETDEGVRVIDYQELKSRIGKIK